MKHTVYRREVFEIVAGLTVTFADDVIRVVLDPTPGDDGEESALAVQKQLAAGEARELGRVLGKLAKMLRGGGPSAKMGPTMKEQVAAWVVAFGAKPFRAREVAVACELEVGQVGRELARQVQAGALRRIGRGQFQAPARRARA